MRIQRTIPILIECNADVLGTVQEFNKFQKTISSICFNNGVSLKALDLHKAVYHKISSLLSAQMKCSAIRLVAAAYASAKSEHRPATRPFVFRKKTALFLIESRGRDASFVKEKLSISTIAGRKKLGFRIPAHFQPDFDAAVSYDAIRITGDGRATLCVTLEVPEPVGSIPVGVDVGIRNIFVASTAKKTLIISGSMLNQRNRRDRKTKSRLQSKLAGKKAQHHDTRSVRRVLKRLSRHTHNRNDTVAKQCAAALCKWAPRGAVLVFEDLRIKPRSKKDHVRRGTRRKLNAWFFRRLIMATKNRAERDRLAMAYVNPAFSSQTHSACGTRGIRHGANFYCPSCRVVVDADVNASHNHRLSFAVLRDGGHQSMCPEARAPAAGKSSVSTGGL
jgi:putative transposase